MSRKQGLADEQDLIIIGDFCYIGHKRKFTCSLYRFDAYRCYPLYYEKLIREDNTRLRCYSILSESEKEETLVFIELSGKCILAKRVFVKGDLETGSLMSRMFMKDYLQQQYLISRSIRNIPWYL